MKRRNICCPMYDVICLAVRDMHSRRNKDELQLLLPPMSAIILICGYLSVKTVFAWYAYQHYQDFYFIV